MPRDELHMHIAQILDAAFKTPDDLLEACRTFFVLKGLYPKNIWDQVSSLLEDIAKYPNRKLELFQKCLFVVENSGYKDLTLLFQGLQLCVILETVEEFVNSSGSRQGITGVYSLSPTSRVQFVGKDLEKAVEDLEKFGQILDELQNDHLIRRVRSTLTKVFVLYQIYLVENSEWDTAALIRAKYLLNYKLMEITESPDKRASQDITFYLDNIAETIGGVHFRAKMTHGTLLKENLLPDGTIICLNRAKQCDGLELDKFAEDLITICHQFTPDQWKIFEKKYTLTACENGGTIEQVEIILNKLKLLAPKETIGQEKFNLPFTVMKAPHWIMRVVRFILRNNQDFISVTVHNIKHAKEMGDLEARINALEILALTFDGIDQDLFTECIVSYINTLNECLLSKNAQIVANKADRASIIFSDSLNRETSFIFNAQAEQAKAILAVEYATKNHLFRSSSHYYLESRHEGAIALSFECLKQALSFAKEPEDLASTVSDLMRFYLYMADMSRDGKYIQAAIEVKEYASQLDEPLKIEINALDYFANSYIEKDPQKRIDLLGNAEKLLETARHSSDLLVTIREALHHEIDAIGNSDNISLPTKPGSMAMIMASRSGDWNYAIVELKKEINKYKDDTEENQNIRIFLASQLAMAYEELADRDPRRRQEAIDAVMSLSDEFSNLALQMKDEEIKLHVTGQMGWALAKLIPYEEYIQRGIELLELALSLGSNNKNPTYFINMSNLANAYHFLSQYKEKSEAIIILEKSKNAFLEVIEKDKEYKLSSNIEDQYLGDSLFLDYMNLGGVYKSMAINTYDATWIHKKNPESASYFRSAIMAFAKSVDLGLDSSPAIAATSSNAIADCFISIWRHYFQERHWAGGDLDRSMYDWLCELAGGQHISTDSWLDFCAESALARATDAINYGVKNHASVLIEAFKIIVELWGISHRVKEMPGNVRLHSVLTVNEFWDRLVDTGQDKILANQFDGMEEVARLAKATIYIDIFRELSHQKKYLLMGTKEFQVCASSAHPLVRSISETMLEWYRLDLGISSINVNGLFIQQAHGQNNLEVLLSDQRRAFTLTNLSLYSSDVEISRKVFSLDYLGKSIAHIEPILDWDNVPEFIPEGKLTAIGDSTEFDIQTVKVPIKTWDAWLITIEPRRPGSLVIKFNLSFWGKYNPITSNNIKELPVSTDSEYDVLSFGQRGLSIDVLPDMRGSVIQVEGPNDDPVISIHGGCRLLIKTTPLISNCESALLVKEEGSMTAVCCGISPPGLPPSRSFPENIIKSFAPIFFFNQYIDSESKDYLRNISLDSLYIVGVPSKRGEITKLLNEMYGPSRDFTFLVLEEEVDGLVEEINSFAHSLHSKFGTLALFEASSPNVGQSNLLSGFQILVTPRLWVPTAIQMLMDLAQIRRVSIEHTPIIAQGKIGFLNTKGNQDYFKRMLTQLSGVASLDDLFALYSQAQEGGFTSSTYSEFASVDLQKQLERFSTGKVAKRPLFLVPSDKQTWISLAPFIELCHAIPVPLDHRTKQLFEGVKPQEIYCCSGIDEVKEFVNSLNCKVNYVNTDQQELCKTITETSDRNFLTQYNPDHSQIKSNAPMLETLRPSKYVMLYCWKSEYTAWAITIANYAAALCAPIVTFPFPENQELEKIEYYLSRLDKLNDPNIWDMPEAKNALQEQILSVQGMLSSFLEEFLKPQLDIIDYLNPTFIGLGAPSLTIPFELAGLSQVSSRYAMGRLTGPTLNATCEIVANAALSEEIYRNTLLNALVICASTAESELKLIDALDEVKSIQAALEKISFVNAEMILDHPSDIDIFIEKMEKLELIHFSGHARNTGKDSTGIEILMTGGALTSNQLTKKLTNRPIVFANACASGVDANLSKNNVQGLASQFMQMGAVNYIGNLWPVVDQSASEFGKLFYNAVCEGFSVGVALMKAKQYLTKNGHTSQNGIILFGCPRNKILNM